MDKYQAYRQRQAEAGLIKVAVWVPIEHKQTIKDQAKALVDSTKQDQPTTNQEDA